MFIGRWYAQLTVPCVSLTLLLGISGSGYSSDPAVRGITVNERALLEELNQRYARVLAAR